MVKMVRFCIVLWAVENKTKKAMDSKTATPKRRVEQFLLCTNRYLQTTEMQLWHSVRAP